MKVQKGLMIDKMNKQKGKEMIAGKENQDQDQDQMKIEIKIKMEMKIEEIMKITKTTEIMKDQKEGHREEKAMIE